MVQVLDEVLREFDVELHLRQLMLTSFILTTNVTHWLMTTGRGYLSFSTSILDPKNFRMVRTTSARHSLVPRLMLSYLSVSETSFFRKSEHCLASEWILVSLSDGRST